MLHVISLGVHGDVGAFNKHESVFCFIWNPLLGTGTTMARRCILTVCRKSEMTPATFDAIFKIQGWPFNVMLSGVTPDTDWEGRPFAGGGEHVAGGWNAALMHIRGDWELYSSAFNFPC